MPLGNEIRSFAFFLALFMGMLVSFVPLTRAQQTLGGITGTVMETTGSVVPGTVVTLVGDETGHESCRGRLSSV